jgi:hypothetical protein
MHSFDYELDEGKKVVVHCDGDYTGRAIWTIVENNERIVEVEASIEDVQVVTVLMNEKFPAAKHITICSQQFPFDAIRTVVEGFAINRMTSMMEDKIYDLGILPLLELEKIWKKYGG